MCLAHCAVNSSQARHRPRNSVIEELKDFWKVTVSLIERTKKTKGWKRKGKKISNQNHNRHQISSSNNNNKKKNGYNTAKRNKLWVYVDTIFSPLILRPDKQKKKPRRDNKTENGHATGPMTQESEF
jgi:hypothetical protein